jgi:hypothetical protein
MVCGVLTPQTIQDLRLSTGDDHEVARPPRGSNNLRVADYVGWDDGTPWSRLPPRDEASDLEWTLYHQEDVITRGQALAGMTDDGLRHLVNSGRWQRLRPGLFLAHNGPLTEGQRLWAATLACGEGAVLAGLTAARAGGLRRAPEPRVHLLVPAGQRPNQPGRAMLGATPLLPAIVVHRTTQLPDKDLAVARPPRTTMARSLVDAAQWPRATTTPAPSWRRAVSSA